MGILPRLRERMTVDSGDYLFSVLVRECGLRLCGGDLEWRSFDRA